MADSCPVYKVIRHHDPEEPIHWHGVWQFKMENVSLVNKTGDLWLWLNLRQFGDGTRPRLKLIVLKHVYRSVLTTSLVIGYYFNHSNFSDRSWHQELFECKLKFTRLIGEELRAEWLVQCHLLAISRTRHELRKLTLDISNWAWRCHEFQSVGYVYDDVTSRWKIHGWLKHEV